MIGLIISLIWFLVSKSEQYKILAIFPHDGLSHHIFFSSLVEELAVRNHLVTVVNYFPLKKMSNLRQISLRANPNQSDAINIEQRLKNFHGIFASFFKTYDSAKAFKHLANVNCERLLTNEEVREILKSGTKYDLVIVEQFVTDCGLAIAYKLNAPTVGMTTHILMPWTYSRLGAPDHPPSRYFSTSSRPNLWNRIRTTIFNFYLNTYYTYVIQRKDQEIVNRFYPDVPDLESLGKKISLMMLNQYFPLTGSRLFGANVIEIGGMHIKQDYEIQDEDLISFLNNADTDVVYISFGTVADNFPSKVVNEIKKTIIRGRHINFIWKVDNISDWTMPDNVLLKKWLPQLPVLCHPKVKAFVTHSGMLSSTEAVYCGVPIVSVPLFGDQFVNAASAVENGLGVAVDIMKLDENILGRAIDTVLEEKYQSRAKLLSELWRDRPLSPMNTTIFWIEYVAKHKEAVQMRPPTVDLAVYQYLNFDVYLIILIVLVLLLFFVLKLVSFTVCLSEGFGKKNKVD